MTTDRVDALEKELASLREEVLALRKKTGELEERMRRVEVHEEVLENPSAPGDTPVKYE